MGDDTHITVGMTNHARMTTLRDQARMRDHDRGLGELPEPSVRSGGGVAIESDRDRSP